MTEHNQSLNDLLTDMRMQVQWSDKATMPIPLYERMKAVIIAMGESKSVSSSAVGCKPAPEDFDSKKARKDLKPEAWDLLKQPVVLSLLYDINLLPEQITTGKDWFYMLSVLSHMDHALKRESVDDKKPSYKTLLILLQNLITLKKHKDTHGKDDFYNKAQPLAWRDAIEALNSIEGQKP